MMMGIRWRNEECMVCGFAWHGRWDNSVRSLMGMGIAFYGALRSRLFDGDEGMID